MAFSERKQNLDFGIVRKWAFRLNRNTEYVLHESHCIFIHKCGLEAGNVGAVLYLSQDFIDFVT